MHLRGSYLIHDLSLPLFLFYSITLSRLSMRRLPSTGLCYLLLTRGNLAIKHEIAFTSRHSWNRVVGSAIARVVRDDVDVAIDVVGAVVKSNEAIEIPFPRPGSTTMRRMYVLSPAMLFPSANPLALSRTAHWLRSEREKRRKTRREKKSESERECYRRTRAQRGNV